MNSLIKISCDRVAKNPWNLHQAPTMVQKMVQSAIVKNNFDKYNLNCFLSPSIKVSKSDIAEFEDLYSINDLYIRNSPFSRKRRRIAPQSIPQMFHAANLIRWLAGIRKTIVELGIDQGKSCVALSENLLKLFGDRGWSSTKMRIRSFSNRCSNEIIECEHSMFDVNKVQDLIVINPMQSDDTCVMVKCGHFHTVAMGIIQQTMTRAQMKFSCLITAVIDFDVKLVFKPISILPREKMVLQMFQCEPWNNSEIAYFKNHNMVIDIANHTNGFMTLLLNSEKEVTVEQLCGQVSHFRNSYTDSYEWFDRMSMVHIPNMKDPIHDCFFWKDEDHRVLHDQYAMINRSEFDRKEIKQIIIWLIALRESYRKNCLNSEYEGYVVLTRDMLCKFDKLFLKCLSPSNSMMYFQCSNSPVRELNPRWEINGTNVLKTDENGKIFLKNEIFNAKQINYEGIRGIVLNPLNYCPNGSTVFVMPLKKFYTAFRLCGSNYEYDYTLFHKLQSIRNMIVEMVCVNKCILILTEWANLQKEYLCEELQNAKFEDIYEIRNLLFERFTPAGKLLDDVEIDTDD